MGIKERQDREQQAVRESMLTAARDLFVVEGYGFRRLDDAVRASDGAADPFVELRDLWWAFGLRAALDTGRLELKTAWTDLEATTEVVTTQQKALELARESVAIAQVSYENGVITPAELTDAQVALLQTEYLLQQATYARIVAAPRARFAAGVS